MTAPPEVRFWSKAHIRRPDQCWPRLTGTIGTHVGYVSHIKHGRTRATA